MPHQRRALDVAAGRGRHTELLARAGYTVFAVDSKFEAVVAAGGRASVAATSGRRPLVWVADLTQYPLPRAAFDLVVVTRYLQRDLCRALTDSLAPGGVILYETFTEGQRALGWGPTSADHLLGAGELPELFPDLEVLFYEEVSIPESVARIAARHR